MHLVSTREARAREVATRVVTRAFRHAAPPRSETSLPASDRAALSCGIQAHRVRLPYITTVPWSFHAVPFSDLLRIRLCPQRSLYGHVGTRVEEYVCVAGRVIEQGVPSQLLTWLVRHRFRVNRDSPRAPRAPRALRYACAHALCLSVACGSAGDAHGMVAVFFACCTWLDVSIDVQIVTNK